MTDTAELLADLADLVMEHGPDSPEVEAFVALHGDNTEFAELAEVSRDIKRALDQR